MFGSTARGEARANSDIDLLIILNQKTAINRDLYKKWDELFKADLKYSPQFVHLPDTDSDLGSIWLEGSIEGEILYDPEFKTKATIQKVRSKIAAGNYQRKISYGQAYWIKREPHAK